jgi:hypothetical protein
MKPPPRPEPRDDRIAQAEERLRVAALRISQTQERLTEARERLARTRLALGEATARDTRDPFRDDAAERTGGEEDDSGAA